MYNLLSFLIVLFSLVLLIREVVVRFRDFLSLHFLFCVSCLYFVIFPLFFDILSNLFGYSELWELLISLDAINYPYDLGEDMLLRVSIFVGAFNLVVLLTYYIFRKRSVPLDVEYLKYQILQSYNNEKVFVVVFVIVGWIGLLLFILLYGFHWELKGFGYIERVGERAVPFSSAIKIMMRASLALSGISVFYTSMRRQYVLLVVSIVPSLVVSILTSERPYIIPIFICMIFGFVYTGKIKIGVRTIIIFSIGLYVLPLLFMAIRYGAIYPSLLLPFPIQRDTSLNNLYYVFSVSGLYGDEGTGGVNTVRLLLTGVLPSSIFGSDFNASLDVTRYVADDRFDWENGTLHPTLYGWLFVDLKWFGILYGAFLGLVLALQTRITSLPSYVKIGFFSIVSVYVIVGMRGSLQFAYSTAVYGVLFLFLLHFLIKMLPRKPVVSRARGNGKHVLGDA